MQNEHLQKETKRNSWRIQKQKKFSKAKPKKFENNFQIHIVNLLFCNSQKMHIWPRYTGGIGLYGSHNSSLGFTWQSSDSGDFQVRFSLTLRSYYSQNQSWVPAIVDGNSTWNKKFANLYLLSTLMKWDDIDIHAQRWRKIATEFPSLSTHFSFLAH